MPLVPTRRKPKFQYSRSNNIVPTAMPPTAAALLIWPIIATSTMPTSGIVMFANILGTANLSTSLFMSLYVVTYGSICKSPFKGDLEGPTFDL